MEVSQLKKAFAEKMLRHPGNSFLAAKELCGGDISQALTLSVTLEHDSEVARYKNELVEEYGEDYFLPSKAEMVQDVLLRAKDCKTNDDYVKLMRLAADMRGFVEKPGVVINNTQTNTVNKVMTIPMFVNAAGNPLDDNEWENQLIENQQRLVAE